MNNDTQEILANAFSELPQVVQQSIKTADVPGKMKDLASKHKIHIDKWTQLENEMILTLFGVTDPNDLVENIQKHVGLSREEATAINNDAVELIFEPIRKKLQQDATGKVADSDAVIPLDQQKMMQELGEKAPTGMNGEVTSTKTVFQIIQERANGTPPAIPQAVNSANDSTTERHTVKEDMYRELPV